MSQSFLQSKQWRDFQEHLGRKVWGFDDRTFVTKLELPFFNKSYLYSNFFEVAQHTDEIRKIAEEEDAIFLKIEPMLVDGNIVRRLRKGGFRQSAKELQPQKTIIIELSKDDEALMLGMHPKTRYNIRLARKKGIAAARAENKAERLGDFWSLLAQTAERDQFSTHELRYYEELLKVEGTELYLAFDGDILLSVALVMFYEGHATYLHGASSYEHRALMGPHLMHWTIMQDARAHGMREYDFWGIDEERWPGVTRFKRGFGGDEVEYIGAFDYPFQKIWYQMYTLKNKFS